MTSLISRRYADVGVSGLTRPVYYATHHGHLKRNLPIGKSFLSVLSHLVHVDLGSPA